MKNKTLIVIVIILVLVVAIFSIAKNKKKKEMSQTNFEENSATSDVVVEDITFKDIIKSYEGGITNIKANAYNNTNKTKSINVKIILKDKDGNELSSLIQILENIEPGKKKLLQTSILGDYSNVDNIEFKVISDSEVQKY